ncbi:uncharacterized protein LACBIDRAFT_329633 [Laccaria bicolor S238N-H82]|uniref:Predicted protein n=1 Tax=Laccaria bicolor (strain S238N-H82 / ATCC MYA-4686) TaxID=486041 RepID=B0DIN3_LACBS|nr:uncharacterized protein LACBIDRAFT_329633 [Laccaria bicolor S238N-H82]EDR05714.1 predicted protein [Laccaria bicolor S238N-H82]|eukprot:XP_001883818.1 predicted protein [Laccaria bicolor S238N-H82]
MFSSVLQEHHQVIISAMWMITLSIIPPDLVRIGALLVGGVICICDIMNAMRPQVLMKKLQLRFLILEEKIQDTVDSGIIHQSDTNFTARIEMKMGRLRYRTFELHERTLLASEGILQEIKAVWKGHSFEINVCIRDVKYLERDVEINRAKILKNRYHSWSLCTFDGGRMERLSKTEDRTGLNWFCDRLPCAYRDGAPQVVEHQTHTTPFDEIVCSSADSGKLTYWYGKHQLFTTLSQPISIVNLNSTNPKTTASLDSKLSQSRYPTPLSFSNNLTHSQPQDKTSMINLTCVINRATRYSYITPPSSNPPHGTLNDTAAPPSICALLKRCGGDEGDTKRHRTFLQISLMPELRTRTDHSSPDQNWNRNRTVRSVLPVRQPDHVIQPSPNLPEANQKQDSSGSLKLIRSSQGLSSHSLPSAHFFSIQNDISSLVNDSNLWEIPFLRTGNVRSPPPANPPANFKDRDQIISEWTEPIHYPIILSLGNSEVTQKAVNTMSEHYKPYAPLNLCLWGNHATPEVLITNQLQLFLLAAKEPLFSYTRTTPTPSDSQQSNSAGLVNYLNDKDSALLPKAPSNRQENSLTSPPSFPSPLPLTPTHTFATCPCFKYIIIACQGSEGELPNTFKRKALKHCIITALVYDKDSSLRWQIKLL